MILATRFAFIVERSRKNMGTQREYSLKPLKDNIVKRISI